MRSRFERVYVPRKRINTKLMKKVRNTKTGLDGIYTFTYIHISVVPSFGRVELSHSVYFYLAYIFLSFFSFAFFFFDSSKK